MHGHTASPPTEPVLVKPDELKVATNLAANYLVSQVDDNGSFVYQVNMNPAVKVEPGYNWLRHAGSLYALADYYQLTKRPELVPVIENAVNFMRRLSLAPVKSIPGAYAIWTDGMITGAREPRSAKLGAAGLGLVAMCGLNRIKPDSVPAAELHGLARFVLAMQKPNGDSYAKFIPTMGGRRGDWVSLYYPGEAALGLMELYALDQNPAWLEGARKTLQYLALVRRGKTEIPADHWALIATRRIWSHLEKADQETFRQHARQVVDTILSGQVWNDSPAHGGFVADGRTTPTATRLEGLLAAEFLFRDEPVFHKKLEIAISQGIRFLQNSQITAGPYKGAIPRAIARIQSSHSSASSFNPRVTEVRIDYIQHALSAFMQYRTFLDEMD